MLTVMRTPEMEQPPCLPCCQAAVSLRLPVYLPAIQSVSLSVCLSAPHPCPVALSASKRSPFVFVHASKLIKRI